MLNYVLVQLFGWDLKSLWQIANQQRCYALIRGCQFGAALESYRYMMDMSDEPTKAIFLAWAPGKSLFFSADITCATILTRLTLSSQ
jgi:hypothetical protein